MTRQQEESYREAIEEYRAASLARIGKLSGDGANDIAKVLPRRQISNYFFQFRKVFHVAGKCLFTSFAVSFTLECILMIEVISDCKPSFVGQAYIL